MSDYFLDVKIDDFNGAMAAMAEQLKGVATKRDIIKSEVQAILQRTLERTTIADQAKIYSNLAGKEWTHYPKGVAGSKLYLVAGTGRDGHRNRYPDALWGSLQAQLAQSLQTKLAAIGFARKTWYELGILIERPIEAGGAADAEIKGVSAAGDVASNEVSSEGDYVLMVQNNSPLMRWANGSQAFFGAIAARTTHFNRTLAAGVFGDLKKVAQQFPGLEVEYVDAAA